MQPVAPMHERFKYYSTLYDTSDIIRKIGRFCKEQIYVPYFYDKYLSNKYDYKKGDYVLFEVTEEDKKIFPQLKRREEIRLLIVGDEAEEW